MSAIAIHPVPTEPVFTVPGRLSDAWQDWLTQCVVSGVAESEIVAGLAHAGATTGFAEAATVVVRSMTERVQANSPALLEDFSMRPLTFSPSANRVRAFDKDVRIVFALNNPNVALFAELLTDKECDQLVKLARPKLKRSTVVDRQTGGDELSTVRTSEGTHFDRAENALVARIERRIEALTGHPSERGEPLQILHYNKGGEYLAHHDWFDPKDPGASVLFQRGGQRVATMVMYLSEVELAGGTAFPEIEMTVRPAKGCGLYFEYCNEGADVDARLLHAGLPVEQGEKWIATKWIRQGVYAA